MRGACRRRESSACKDSHAGERRCLRLDIPVPDPNRLKEILRAHLDGVDLGQVEELVKDFLRRRDEDNQMLATDQLLNAVFLVTRGAALPDDERKRVLEVLFRELGRT